MNTLANRLAAAACFMMASLCAAPAFAAGNPSTYPGCQTRNVNVAWGASVQVNMSTCHFFGLGTVMPGFAPAHGTATPVEPPGSPVNSYTYQHNGSTPAGGGVDTFRVLDDNSDYIVVNVTISAPASPITVAPTTLPAMTAGTPFSQTLTSSGGVGSYTYALQSGSLPVGLSLTSVGLLSGTPTQRGSYSFTVRSTDSRTPTAQFVDKGYSGTVQVPTISLTSGSGTAIQSVPFSQTLTITGGVTPHKCQLETGSFPSGISVSQSCVVSGTTNAAATNYSVTIRVTDSSTPANAPYFELESYTLTVSPPPSVSIALSPTSMNEDAAGTMSATLTRSLNLSSPTVVNLTIAGTATNGTDFATIAATATIPANSTTTTVVIDPTTDTTVEANETVSITVAAGTGYTVGASSNVVGTINNDDVPSVSISASPASVVENETPNLVYTVTLSQANPAAATSINYSITGNASVGTDFASIASPLIIPAGNTSGTITVDPTADTMIEADETVTLTLTNGTGYSVGAPNAATGTITNDDFPTATLAVAPGAVAEDGTGNLAYTITLAPPNPFAATTVNYAVSGSAGNGSDYALISSPLVVAANTGSATVIVDPSPDTTVEGDETVTLTLAVGTGYSIGASNLATGIISNDDLPRLSISDASVTEGQASTVTVQVSLDVPALAGGVSFRVQSGDQTALAGLDYTAINQAGLVIPAGQTMLEVSVPLANDALDENVETLILTVDQASGATLQRVQGTVTIQDDDPMPTLSVANVTVVEGSQGANTPAAFPLTLSAVSGRDISVQWQTADDSATAGSDYLAGSGTAQIAAGQTETTIPVTVVDDSLVEDLELFTLTISNAVNAGIAPGGNLAMGGITSEDQPLIFASSFE